MAIAPTPASTPLPPASDPVKPDAGTADAGGFLALLNIGTIGPASSSDNTPGNSGGTGNAGASRNAPPQGGNNQKEQDKQDTPDAAPVDTAAPIQNAPSSNGGASGNKNSAPASNDDAPAPQRDTQPAAHARGAADATDDADAPQDRPVTASSNDAGADAAPAAQDAPSEPEEKDAPLRDAIKDQLAQIDQILLAIIQAFAPSLAPVATAPASSIPAAAVAASTAPALPAIPMPDVGTPAAATDTAITDAAPPPVTTPSLPDAALAALLVPAAPYADTGSIPIPVMPASPAEQEVALLKDIQSLLQKMQQVLQATDAAPTPAATPQQGEPQPAATKQDTGAAASGTLQSLMDALQKDVTQLTALAKPQPDPGAALAPLPAAPLPAPAFGIAAGPNAAADNAGTTPSAFPEQFRFAIAQVRTQLQKLNNDNETIYTKAKTALQAQFEKAQLFFQSSQDSVDAAPITAATDTFTAQPPVPPAPTLPQASQVQPQNTAYAISTIQIVQAPLDTSADTSSDGGGQHQPAPLPITVNSNAATSAPASGTPDNSPFTRALNRATPPSLPEQVVFQVKTALADGSSKISIQLDPAELGKMDIRLHVDEHGKTGVVITVENRTTLDLLQRDAQGLARALNDAGLSTDSGSLSFNLRGGEQEQGKNSQAAQTYKKAQPDEEDEELTINVLTRSYVVNLAEGLDIKI